VLDEDEQDRALETPRPESAEAPYSHHHSFAMERQLHEFLWENWDQTELGQEWVRYTETGDERAGYEHVCGVGRIDILARHRRDGRWLVVELKRGQSNDETVGQVLRYIGWVNATWTGRASL